MKRIQHAIATALLLSGPMTLASCAGATPEQKAEAANETYAADMLGCVEGAGTLEESRACRAKARAKWHVDGGAR